MIDMKQDTKHRKDYGFGYTSSFKILVTMNVQKWNNMHRPVAFLNAQRRPISVTETGVNEVPVGALNVRPPGPIPVAALLGI